MPSPDKNVGLSAKYISDLSLISAFTVVTATFIFIPELNGTLLRSVFAFVFVLFVPGYTVVTALLPKKEHRRVLRRDEDQIDIADNKERSGVYLEVLVLSFGMSIALTIVIGLGLGLREAGINRIYLFSSLVLVTGVFLLITAIRRRRIPPKDRFQPPIGVAVKTVRSSLYTERTTGETIRNVVLVVAVALAVASVGISLAEPRDDSITEFALLSQNDDGEFVASDYPSSLTQGVSEGFAIRIQNQEGGPITYTVVVLLQLFEESSESSEPRDPLTDRELHRFNETLEDGESEVIDHSITPEGLGSNYRLTYLLYTNQPPANPSVDNAYRELHLWVTIEPSSS